MGTTLGVMKINLRLTRTAYLIFGIVFIVGLSDPILSLAMPDPDDYSLAVGTYIYLLPLLLAVFIPAQNFSKLMNLGGKRMDFFYGSLLTYLLITAVVTLLSVILFFILDPIMRANTGLMNLLDIFSFMSNGAVVAFLQMFAFLSLCCCVFHTLTLIQGHWYGFVVDVIIIAVISVFTPIATLRAALVWFFNMIIFHDIAIVQIVFCLVLSVGIYCASLIPIRTKQI